MDETALASLELEALLQFLYLAPVGLVQTRADGDVLMLNPKCAQWLMPLAPDGDLRNLFDSLSPLLPDLRQRVAAFSQPSGTICAGLYLPLNSHGDRGTSPIVLSLTLIRLDHDRLMAVLDDVTEQLRRERALRQSQAWLHSFVKGAGDYACMTLDAQGCVQDWSDSVRRLTGHSPEQVLGKHYSVLLENAEPTNSSLAEADAGGWVIEERNLRHVSGTPIWGNALLAAQHEPGEQDPIKRGYSLVVRNMQDQKAAIDELKRVVGSDFLTGIANRRAFLEIAERELERCSRLQEPVSVLMCDVDRFKAVNDSYGHAAGDSVLRHIASVLAQHVRETDTVARFGGEEFVILMPGLSGARAYAAADGLRAVLGQAPVAIEDGQYLTCTISIGIASADTTPAGLEQLIKHADQALYAAKAAGRNRVEMWDDLVPAACA